MNVSTLRKKLESVADAIESSTIAEPSRVDIVQFIEAKEIPMERVEYNGGFYSRIYYLIKNDMYFDAVTPKLINHKLSDIDKGDLLSYYSFLKKDRVLKIAAMAFGYAIDGESSPIIKNESNNRYLYLQYDEDRYRKEFVVDRLRSASQGKIQKNLFAIASKKYQEQLESIEKLLTADTKKSKRGLAEYYENKPGETFESEDEEKIESQSKAAYDAMPSNGLTSRTWGFEVEVADAKDVEAPFNIEKGEDGSLRSYEAGSECDCDCDDCSYHDCDCDYCESVNTDPEHCNNSYCSNADMAEFRSRNGIGRLKHAGLFKLCKSLAAVEAEVNDTCGVHIHVYSADLKPEQVAQVLASYKWLENILGIVASREDTSYAKKLSIGTVVRAMKKKEFIIDKAVAVNVMHMGMTGTRGTIEFRQMLGNYDAERITFWAWLVRGLVETAKRGAKFHHFKNVKDINGMIEVYGKFNYYLHDEGTELLVPGGRLDNNYITKNTLERAVN